MHNPLKPTVWLACVSAPFSAASHLERSLRSLCTVVTIGPSLPPGSGDAWHPRSQKYPAEPPDIETGLTPDMLDVIANSNDFPAPDLFLWVESVSGFEPRNIPDLNCPTACYLIDSHPSRPEQLKWAQQFDHLFVAQKERLGAFREQHPRSHWLPLGCDPAIHRSTGEEKQYDVGCVGEIEQGSRQEQLLLSLAQKVPVHCEHCFGDEQTSIFSLSRIVFNSASYDLSMRFFEALSTGTLLLSDMAAGSGQDELFREGEDYVRFQQHTLVDLAEFYLNHASLREAIANRGRHLVHNAHTYTHRAEDLLEVTLRGKPDTFSAPELRKRSLAGISDLFHDVRARLDRSSSLRSFVIPVLDYSPASEYNIVTLLRDLEQIEGEVIVVFNSPEVANDLKDHPRITRYAIMKQNIGVSRAWNTGISMSSADTVFIVNADAHISSEAVDCLHNSLHALPDACCVGPQGSFVNFEQCRDYHHFGKGSFSTPIAVDAVSGFFFALDRHRFSWNGIAFDEIYTPCYFEEWDTGLQISRAGLKSYVVPTTAYDHHWGGTINARRTIPYMDRNESAGVILVRNRQLFLAKWKTLSGKAGHNLLASGWKQFLMTNITLSMEEGSHTVDQLTTLLQQDFPADAEAAALIRFARFHRMKA